MPVLLIIPVLCMIGCSNLFSGKNVREYTTQIIASMDFTTATEDTIHHVPKKTSHFIICCNFNLPASKRTKFGT